MRHKISAYKGLLRDSQSNLERMKSLSDDEKEVYKDSLNDSDRQIDRMAKLLTEEVRRRTPVFDEVAESKVMGDHESSHSLVTGQAEEINFIRSAFPI